MNKRFNDLMPGEELLYGTRLHRAIFLIPLTYSGVGFCLFIFGALHNRMVLGIFGFAISGFAGLAALMASLSYLGSYFGITAKRVLIKRGILRRSSAETLLAKIESIAIDQSFLGRLLDFGSVVIVGTGGTKEPFPFIQRPNEFRRIVQEQIERGKLG